MTCSPQLFWSVSVAVSRTLEPSVLWALNVAPSRAKRLISLVTPETNAIFLPVTSGVANSSLLVPQRMTIGQYRTRCRGVYGTRGINGNVFSASCRED
jgi:hypothetical protein